MGQSASVEVTVVWVAKSMQPKQHPHLSSLKWVAALLNCQTGLSYYY